MAATPEASVEVCKLLLAANADPNHQADMHMAAGVSALHLAVYRALRWSRRAYERPGQSASPSKAHGIVRCEGMEITRMLLAAGARQLAFEYGVTPLIAACEGCSAELVRELLTAGHSPLEGEYHGRTPLEVAALHSSSETHALLSAAVKKETLLSRRRSRGSKDATAVGERSAGASGADMAEAAARAEAAAAELLALEDTTSAHNSPKNAKKRNKDKGVSKHSSAPPVPTPMLEAPPGASMAPPMHVLTTGALSSHASSSQSSPLSPDLGSPPVPTRPAPSPLGPALLSYPPLDSRGREKKKGGGGATSPPPLTLLPTITSTSPSVNPMLPGGTVIAASVTASEPSAKPTLVSMAGALPPSPDHMLLNGWSCQASAAEWMAQRWPRLEQRNQAAAVLQKAARRMPTRQLTNVRMAATMGVADSASTRGCDSPTTKPGPSLADIFANGWTRGPVATGVLPPLPMDSSTISRHGDSGVHTLTQMMGPSIRLVDASEIS